MPYTAPVMKIQFRDEVLSLIRTDRAAETKLPFPVIKSCRQQFVVLDAAPDERTLKNWKSLNYKKPEGEGNEQRSIRVHDHWRIVFTIDDASMPPTLWVEGINTAATGQRS